MLTWLIKHRIAAFERRFGYDASYIREVLASDARAFWRFARVSGMSAYRRDVPAAVYYAVGITGSLAEDCGPCTQLGVTMALQDGVDPRAIASILEGTEAVMTDEVRLGVRFARAVPAHAPEADEARDEIVKRWGPRALVSPRQAPPRLVIASAMPLHTRARTIRRARPRCAALCTRGLRGRPR